MGAVILLFVSKTAWVRGITLTFTSLALILSWLLFFQFDASSAALQFVEKKAGAPEMGMSYFLGLDGISFPLILLTTLLFLGFFAGFVVKLPVVPFHGWLPPFLDLSLKTVQSLYAPLLYHP